MAVLTYVPWHGTPRGNRFKTMYTYLPIIISVIIKVIKDVSCPWSCRNRLNNLFLYVCACVRACVLAHMLLVEIVPVRTPLKIQDSYQNFM